MKNKNTGICSSCCRKFILNAGDAMATEDNTISVRGIAKQEVAPDMAYLTLGISVVKGDTAESVRTQAAEAKSKGTSGFVRDGDQ